VLRGIQVVEYACGIPNLLLGETSSPVAQDMEIHSYRMPIGVTAGICPFNFPAMIPLWMFPMAIACGNTMVLKPSERDPGAAMMMAQMAQDAGLPDGCLNIIHGGHDGEHRPFRPPWTRPQPQPLGAATHHLRAAYCFGLVLVWVGGLFSSQRSTFSATILRFGPSRLSAAMPLVSTSTTAVVPTASGCR
jgi:hypothetical protein